MSVGNDGWDLVDSSERREDVAEDIMEEFLQKKDGRFREKKEPKQTKCWRSEVGVRLEESPTLGKGCRGQGKAQNDVAKLCADDRADLVPARSLDMLFLVTAL